MKLSHKKGKLLFYNLQKIIQYKDFCYLVYDLIFLNDGIKTFSFKSLYPG